MTAARKPQPGQRHERGIMFKDEMVRAILAGTKTQTRRVVRPQPENGVAPCHYSGTGWAEMCADGCCGCTHPVVCPYGQPGDALWVRETFAIEEQLGTGARRVVWRSDNESYVPGFDGRWRPSIHMPRWASRITLPLISVRVEGLQDISEKGAKAEGLAVITKDGHTWKYGIPDRDGFPGTDDDGWEWQDWNVDPRKAFQRLWTSINGPESWDANPWVWVLEWDKPEERP